MKEPRKDIDLANYSCYKCDPDEHRLLLRCVATRLAEGQGVNKDWAQKFNDNDKMYDALVMSANEPIDNDGGDAEGSNKRGATTDDDNAPPPAKRVKAKGSKKHGATDDEDYSPQSKKAKKAKAATSGDITVDNYQTCTHFPTIKGFAIEHGVDTSKLEQTVKAIKAACDEAKAKGTLVKEQE